MEDIHERLESYRIYLEEKRREESDNTLIGKLEEFGFNKARCTANGLNPDPHVAENIPRKQLQLMKKLRTIREEQEKSKMLE